MALVPWDVHVKVGQLAALAAAVAAALFTTARRRPPTTPPPPKTPPAATPLPAQVVPCRSAPTATAAITDLCTCVSELASDLAKRYGDES
ncbi:MULTISPECIES: hypothetical protein [unclassified Streptomyces]|uniref:hypothetical protein n=1 Tax=unclassified Streptomyces TaxID=2593676 RepID=UPI00278BCA54|nr:MULTISPECIES: hypothetical protein [unclassified Streptomyces]